MPAGARRSSRIVVPGLIAIISACAGEPTGTAGEAEFRVLHATQALGSVDVDVAGVRVISGVSFGTASPLVRVPAGRQRVVVRAGGQVLGELDPTLTVLHVNSLIVADGSPQFLATVAPDTGDVASDRANIRMVNVAGPGAPPTLLDILVSAPNVNPDSIITFGLDTQIASYGPLMLFDAGQFHFRFVPDGGGATLAEVSFTVVGGEKKAVVLERSATGGYRAQVVVEQ